MHLCMYSVSLLVFFAAISLVAQPSAHPSTARTGPILHFPLGNTLDFGRCGPSKVHGIVSLANLGDDTLRIFHAKSSCGCMVGEVLQSTIPPGDTVPFLRVSLDLSHKRGSTHKTFAIYTNDSTTSSNGLYILQVAAMVVLDIEWWVESTIKSSYQSYHVIESLEIGKSVSETLHIKAIGDSSVTLYSLLQEEQNGLAVSAPSFREPLTLEPGEAVAITLNVQFVRSDDFPHHNYPSGRIKILTSSLRQPRIELSVYVSNVLRR